MQFRLVKNLIAMKTKKRMLAGKTLVTITDDCRLKPTGPSATGQTALFLGRFMLGKYPKTRRYRGCRGELANPVFQLSDGTKIWGIECWWKRLA